MYRSDGISSDYMLWLNESMEIWPSLTVDFSYGSDFWSLLAYFNGYSPTPFNGYILANLTDGSVNAAVALCAILGGLVVTEENEDRARNISLGLLEDVRGKDLSWVLDTFGTEAFSKRITLLQSPSKTGMSDFAVAVRALPWWVENASLPLARRVWGALQPPAFGFGWGPDELNTVSEISRVGGAMIASDWASNLDVLSSFDLPSLAPRATADAGVSTGGGGGGVHTACFLMSDGDNVQWILGGMALSPSYFSSPARGKVPMGWTLPPSLADLAPAALHYFYSRGTSSDGFVGGVSGAGYFYPDLAAAAAASNPLALPALINLTTGYAAKAGLSILNVMTYGDSLSEALAASYFDSSPNLEALFHYPYSDYAGDHGRVYFHDGKPVIGGRFSLWGDGSQGADFLNVTQAAEKLKAASRDVHSSDGYSLIRKFCCFSKNYSLAVLE